MSIKAKRKRKITVAVRDFALPLKRIGSLGQGRTSAIPLDVGTEIHERIQQRLLSEGEPYRPEVSLSTVLSGHHHDIKIRGRCDGIFDDGQNILLEEIKSSFNLASLKRALEVEADHPYILQLKLYAYIHQLKYSRSTSLQLRLVDSRSLREEVLPVDFDFDVFSQWVKSKLIQVEENLDRYRAIIKTRKALALQLFFPFEKPRNQQAELVEAVSSALKGKRKLLLQAPTGLGKTAGVLFPTLREAFSQGSPVVYIAPKNSQFQAAVDLAKKFQKAKIKLKVLILTSKSKACQADEVLCQNSSCPLSMNYYDKISEHDLKTRDKKKHLWDYKYFQGLAQKFEICPYEIGMERVPEADLIICDYNYIFSPQANFFDRYLDPILPMKKPFLVIDEAHNLYERVIENYSPQIKLSDLKAFLESCRSDGDDRFARIVQRAIGLMSVIKPRSPAAKVDVKKEAISELLNESLALILSRWGDSGLPLISDPLFQFYQQWLDLSEISELSQEAIPLIYKREDGDEILRAQCLDPSFILEPIHSLFAGVVAFSATLKPFDFYRHMSGFSVESSDALEFTSPFPRDHKKIMIIPQVETNFRQRSRHYERIASVIEKVAEVATGPYLVFFSSYSFLREVEKFLQSKFALYTQSASLNESGVRAIMRLLSESRQTTLVLAVQGGSLAEGIDFKGLGLRGVFVVGPAVPTASFERKLMQEHFEKILDRDKGRAYAYVYPAMTRSVQAAGRVVRDEEERGVIVLMDPRFLEKDYSETMPEDWFQSHSRELVPTQIIAETADFWIKNQPPKTSLQGPMMT